MIARGKETTAAGVVYGRGMRTNGSAASNVDLSCTRFKRTSLCAGFQPNGC